MPTVLLKIIHVLNVNSKYFSKFTTQGLRIRKENNHIHNKRQKHNSPSKRDVSIPQE